MDGDTGRITLGGPSRGSQARKTLWYHERKVTPYGFHEARMDRASRFLLQDINRFESLPLTVMSST